MIPTSGRTHLRGEKKRQKTTINHDDGDMAPLGWYKISRECDTSQSIRKGSCTE